MTSTRLVALLGSLALVGLLSANALPEPEARAPFALAGNATYDAHTRIESSFPAGLTRVPVFHFADNALSAHALRAAHARERAALARETLQTAVATPPYPGAVAQQAFGLPAAVALAAGGEIPDGAGLTAVLDRVLGFSLPDGSQPFRELVSADLGLRDGAWHAEGMISEVFLRPDTASPALERELRQQLTLDTEGVQTRTLLGLQDTIQAQIAGVVPWLGGAVLLMLLVVGAYFAAWREVVAAGAGLVLLVATLSGLRKLLGLPESQLTSMLPILLLALGVDYAIHSLQRLRQNAATQGGALRTTIRDMAPALLLTTATSAVAFGSSSGSRIADLRDWGLLAAGGIGLAYAVMGWAVPALRVALGRSAVTATAPTDALPARVPFAARYPRLCLAAGALGVVAAAGHAGGLAAGFDLEDFLAADVPYVQTVNRVAAAFPQGGEPATVLLEGPLTIESIEDLAATLREQGLARQSELEHVLRDARTGSGNTPCVLRAGDQLSAIALPVQVHRAGEWASLGRAHDALTAASRSLQSRADVRVTITGAPFLRYAYVNALTDAVRDGIVLTLALCFGIACLAFRSLRWGLVALLPVAAVCIGLQAIMALAGLRLNLVTVQVVALAIGLGSDYMLHYVQRFRELNAAHPSVSPLEHLARTHADTGRAVQGSAVSTLIGFGLLAAAPMPLFATFGRIQLLMVGLSLIAVTWVLPALVVIAGARAKPRRLPGPVKRRPEEALCA